MSAAQMQAVLDAEIRPCAAKCVAMALAWHCSAETGHAWPSMDRILRAEIIAALAQLTEAD